MLKFRFTAAVFAAVFAALLGGPLAAEDAPRPKKPAVAGGKVKAVDAKGGTVTITRSVENKDQDVIVRFAANAQIAVDGKVAKFEDVPVGAPHANVYGGKLEASQVADAEGLWVVGKTELVIFRKVSGDTLTFKPDGPPANNPPDKTAKLAADAKAMVGGKEGKLTDFKPGDRMTIRYTADGKAIHSLARTSAPKKK